MCHTEGGSLLNIRKLYKKIPSFKCKPGCHDCCGPVPWAKVEWDKIKDKRVQDSINCPYIGKEGCDCYENRPMLCRLFGTVKGMKCPHGCGPVKYLSQEDEYMILKKWKKHFES